MPLPLPAGIHYGVPEERYHADNLRDVPTLSRSCAHRLLTRSPLHAWQSHPRLNPAYVSPQSEAFDFGNAAHARVLLGVDLVDAIEADDWRTKAARDAKNEARAAGRVAMLAHELPRFYAMCDALHGFVRPLGLALTGGESEATALYQDAGVWCRSRFDYLPRDPAAFVLDYKTTRNAAPDAFMRAVWTYGYDFQAAWYSRALKVLRGAAPAGFVFIAQEKEPPFAVTAHRLSPQAFEHAEARCDEALSIWRRCLENNEWPAYEPVIHEVPPPPWSLDREAEMIFDEESV